MKKIKAIAVVLSVVFLAVSAAYANPQGKDRKYGDEGKGRIFKELNLTPEQQKSLEENRKAQHEEMVKLHTAMKEKKAKLQEELKNPAVTRASVDPLVNEIKSLQAQLIDHRINGIFAVKQILTPEQFAKFQQITEKHREERKGLLQNGHEKQSPQSAEQEE